MEVNVDRKLTILISLWVLDKIIMLAMLLIISCTPFDYTCNNNEAFHWECECVGVMIMELEEPPEWGKQDATWFLCCNVEQDSCWHRVLDND